MKLNDLTGNRYGRLVVIERSESRGHYTFWLCRCDCGETIAINAYSLKDGRTKSCGCYRRNDHAVITYEGAHWRIRQAKGPASKHSCVDCGGRARQWSYDYTDPQQVTCPTRGSVYSLDPSRYVPRCASCHKKHDLQAPVQASA